MATARIRLRGQLKKLAGDQADHQVGGSTVAELLVALTQAQPALDGWVTDERGHVRRHINVFVNGDQARADRQVADGDTVDILPAISGG
jgi:molybdopterin converting factor small subunit